ncbi:transmembrane protein, putative [Medicago truncatula]|uniref:Transmembrane protein, putative n=1 Tax=Medicago truncatula TaxID=3880 RepID=G7K8M9_MEDTR|nr:transmembrane protein, putative [Medicago truncatula]
MSFTKSKYESEPPTFTFNEPPDSVFFTKHFDNSAYTPYRAPTWVVWFLSVIEVVIAASIIRAIFSTILRRQRSTPHARLYVGDR